MKKNYWLLLAFLLLGGATALLLLGKPKNEASKLGWDRVFKVENPDDIQKIFIAKRTGETTTLVRNGNHWLVNDSSKVSPGVMENVLEAVTNIELKFVPPQAAVQNIASEMAARGIKVEVYGKNGKKLKAYYIGGVTADARGTYAILEGSEQPMAVGIPQMEGQIRTRFDISGDPWRDRAVFEYQPEDIQAVSIEYPQQRNKSFKLVRRGNNFEIQPFYDNVPPIQRPVQQGKVEGFLTGFKRLAAESYENQYAAKDSVRQMVPFATISVTDMKGKERRATLYPFYRKDAQTGQQRSEIVERYFADLNSDWMLVQQGVFKEIFWPYDAFFARVDEKVKG